jgi:demethoxyubiquinone hydroxylase (CLK1/Coq7/Cat5 family)
MPSESSLARLVAILQLAYSGERAAGYAYRGHARSVSAPAERERIQKIEDRGVASSQARRRNAADTRATADPLA